VSVLARLRTDRFARVLALVVLVAAGVRFTYVLWGKGGTCTIRTEAFEVRAPTECPGGPGERPNDAVYYNAAANHLARGGGFTDPFHPDEPAADHPPLTVVVLAPVSWIGDRLDLFADPTNLLAHRLTMALLGTAVVAGIGLVGRRLAGERAGLVAAGLGAVYPGLWISDALIFAETITALLVVASLWAALAARAEASPRRFAVLGACCALGALARAELLLLLPLYAVVLVRWRRPRSAMSVIVRRAGAFAGAALVVLAPWVVYNTARFAEPTFVSTNDGLAIAASNCDPVYYGPGIGLTSYEAAPPGASAAERARGRWCIEDPPPAGDQSQVSKAYRERAWRYVRSHTRRVPLVVAARVGRVWNVFRPFDMVRYNEGEDREPWATRAAIWTFFPVALAAAGGAARRYRLDRRSLAVLVAPLVVVTVGAALTYGQARYRAAAEPALVLLAACGMVREPGSGRRAPVR
jgi:4-amino-4-deoxy-L-arabinose transferase-like glycosyltransferase